MSDEKPQKTQSKPEPAVIARWLLEAKDRDRLKLAYGNQQRASNWLLFKTLIVGTLLGAGYYGFIQKGEGFITPVLVAAISATVLVMVFREISAIRAVRPLRLAGEMVMTEEGLELRGPDGIVWEHKSSPDVRTYWKVLRIYHASQEFLFNEVWVGDGSAYGESRPVLVPIPESANLDEAVKQLEEYNKRAYARAKG